MNHPTPNGASTLASAIATGITELTGPGNASFLQGLHGAGLGKVAGVAPAVRTTLPQSCGPVRSLPLSHCASLRGRPAARMG